MSLQRKGSALRNSTPLISTSTMLLNRPACTGLYESTTWYSSASGTESDTVCVSPAFTAWSPQLASATICSAGTLSQRSSTAALTWQASNRTHSKLKIGAIAAFMRSIRITPRDSNKRGRGEAPPPRKMTSCGLSCGRLAVEHVWQPAVRQQASPSCCPTQRAWPRRQPIVPRDSC